MAAIPATARGLYLPRRRLYKPRGSPRIIWPKAPRGLMLCVAMSDGSFFDLTGQFGRPTAINTMTLISGSRGFGASYTDATQNISYQYGAQPPTTWSMEALFIDTADTTNGWICGWNQTSDGTSATFDRSFFSGGYNSLGGSWNVYIFDGAAKNVNGAAGIFGVGKAIHLVGTCDGSTLTLYVNGASAGSVAVSNGGFTSYTLPVYFSIGSCGSVTSSPSGFPFTGTKTRASQTANLVNFANASWTAAEVMARYLNPFGFLTWPEERRNSAAAASGITPYDPWPLWMPLLSQ